MPYEFSETGKRTLVPGWMNKIMIGSTRLTPRSVLATVAVFVVLPIWLMWKLASWMFRGRARRDVPRQDPSEGVDPA